MGSGYFKVKGYMAILLARGDMNTLCERGRHGYTAGKWGHGCTGGKWGHGFNEVKSEVSIVRVRKDVNLLRERGDIAILRVRKCDVTLLMTVGTVCIAACTAVPRIMAITKLQAALCCLPAHCILSCTIWLTVLKFITSQL